jgi:hypothetical protein
LVTQDAHIQEVTRMLQESVSLACRVYASRNAASIGSTPGTRRTSVNTTNETPLSCDTLDAIISYVEQVDFSSTVLNNLSNCAQALKSIRDAVIKSEWEVVSTLAGDDDIVRQIHEVPFAIPELTYARQDAHNRITANKLESVLSQEMTEEMLMSGTTMSHENLAQVISEAEVTEITAMATQQLLECAKNVYLLRVGLSSQDSKQVAQALRWFGVNAYRCPVSVQDEAKKAFIMHQNSLLLTGLTTALQTGYATGELGDMNISTVDTTVLSKLLAQAHDVAYQTTEVQDIVDIAEMIYCLRCAQRAKDSDGISKALEMLSSWGKMLPAVVVEEVAFARSERDNALTVKILESTFSTFDLTNTSSLEMSLKTGGMGDAYLLKFSEDPMSPIPFSQKNNTSGSRNKQQLQQQQPTTQGRRYSYASLNRADIDFETIDVQTLDTALVEAKKYGMYTDLSKSLYRTVFILRSLRFAMKQNDWPKVEEILLDVDKTTELANSMTSSTSHHIKIHHAAEKELQVIKNQLEMRTSIVDLSKALKTGWARCTNGIVDTDTLQVESLIDAISRAERSMQDLGISNDMKKIQIRTSSLHSNQLPHTPTVTSGKTDISVSLSIKGEDQSSRSVATSSPSIKRYRKHFPLSTSPSPSPATSTSTTITTIASSENLRKKVLDSSVAAAAAAVAPPKSKLQEQVEKLLLSAGIVTEVRKALQEGNINLAGELSEEALQIPELHTSVQEELTHYATEIGRALQMMRLCSELRAGIVAGNGEHIERILQEAREATIELSSDLGLIRTMEKAQSVLKSINKLKKELNTVSHIYSIQRSVIVLSHLHSPLRCANLCGSIDEALAAAKKLNITGYLIDNAVSRVSVLKQFEVGLQDLNVNTGGIVTGRQAQQVERLRNDNPPSSSSFSPL